MIGQDGIGRDRAAWEAGGLFCNRKLSLALEGFFTMGIESGRSVPVCRMCFLAGAVLARGAIDVEGERRYAQYSAGHMMTGCLKDGCGNVGAKSDGAGGSSLAFASRANVPRLLVRQANQMEWQAVLFYCSLLLEPKSASCGIRWETPRHRKWAGQSHPQWQKPIKREGERCPILLRLHTQFKSSGRSRMLQEIHLSGMKQPYASIAMPCLVRIRASML
jgi:hypothetical protein